MNTDIVPEPSSDLLESASPAADRTRLISATARVIASLEDQLASQRGALARLAAGQSFDGSIR